MSHMIIEIWISESPRWNFNSLLPFSLSFFSLLSCNFLSIILTCVLYILVRETVFRLIRGVQNPLYYPKLTTSLLSRCSLVYRSFTACFPPFKTIRRQSLCMNHFLIFGAAFAIPAAFSNNSGGNKMDNSKSIRP